MSAPAASRSRRHRLVGESVTLRGKEGAGAEVVEHDGPMLVGEAGQGRRLGQLGEAGLPEVRGVDSEDDPRLPCSKWLEVVVDPGPVRGPDLVEADAGPAKDLRDPNAAADLDQLAAPDDDPAATTGQPDREGNRGGVVVRDESVLGTRQGDQVLLGGPEPCPAPPGRPVELEEQVVAGSGARGLDRDCRPRCPAEVRVDDHARRVDRRVELRGGERLEAGAQLGGEVGGGLGLAAGRQAFALPGYECPGDIGRGCPPRPIGHVAACGGQDRLDARRVGAGLGRHRSSWRERMGVEPTAPRLALRHWF